MNPNYVSPGMQAYYPNMPYQSYPAQQFGYPTQGGFPIQPKQQTNAVNIEIIGPTANGQGPGGAMPFYPGMSQVMQPQMPSMMPQMPPQLMQPMPMPPMAPPQMIPPPPAPPMYPPVSEQQFPPYMAPQQPPMAPPMPPMMPPPPPPAIDQIQPNPLQQPQINQPVAPTAPMAQGTEILAGAIKTITPEPGQAAAGLDQQAEALKTLSGFINGANTMDPASQKSVNEMLLPNDGRTFKGLAAIAASDTSAIQGPEKQKADEVRVMSLLTLANLQKYFRQEFDNQLKQENISDVPSISLGELPGIKTVQQIVQADPNPEVREAGIFALMGIAEPSNPQDIQALKTVLQNSAKNDTSEKVKATAKEALGVVEANNASA